MKKWLLMTCVLAAAGCGGGQTQAEEPVAEPEPMAEEPAPVEQTPVAVEDPDDVRIVGDHLEVDGHINFETDSDTILADSNELLDHIAQLVNNHADEIRHLRIIGHTDEAGGDEHNMELSDRRAAAVEQALRDRGVTIELEHGGVGETQPLCEEDTDECHARNRRVEFLIVAHDEATEG